MALVIKTNNHWRDFYYRCDVPADVLADQFSWTLEDHDKHGDYSDGFLCYRGIWYHTADFVLGGIVQGDKWDGAHGDSYFSGVLICVSEDGDQYQIATYTS